MISNIKTNAKPMVKAVPMTSIFAEPLNPTYKEILRLKDMLDEEGIPYLFRRLHDGYQILSDETLSVVQHRHMDCAADDKLSFFRGEPKSGEKREIVPEVKIIDEKHGLSAEEALKKFKDYWSKI